MDIKRVSSSQINQVNEAVKKQQQQNLDVQNKESKKSTDRLEISDEARVLLNKNVEAKDLEAIKQKVDKNFYNSDEVINKVADSILKEINGEK